jgi:dTDP-4-dehydrorhamnose reductase
MKLWVTGADGLLGSVLRKSAALATGRREADIGDLEAIRSFASLNPGITHIVNCAAFSLVDLAEAKRDEAFRANALGPENLGILAAEIGARIVHISTDYVFPGTLRRPLKEDDPVEPRSHYGVTKLEGERRLLKVHPKACIIRTSWIFGHGGKNFVAKLLHMLQEQEEIRLTDDNWNLPTYAPDLSNAILRMLEASGIYHFANRGAANKYEFGLAMREEAEAAGFSIAAKRILGVPASTFPSPAGRPVYSVFDLSKIERELGVPIRPWREGLREFLQEAYGKIS